MNIIEKMMWAIATEMTPPAAYGTFHIILIAVGLTLAIGLAFLLRNISERGNKILLLSISGALILSEIVKQIFLYYVNCGGAVCWGEFPFQMCSMPMYLCPIAVLCKSERIKRAAYGFMMTFNMLGGLAGVFEPSGVFHSRVFLTAHSVVWHYLLVFIAFYVLFSGRSGWGRRDYFDLVKLFCVLCFTAFLINTLIGITTGAVVNMFFVGPNPAPIIVFSDIANKYGWVASTVLYIPLTSIAAGVIFYLGGLLSKKKRGAAA